MRCLHFFSHGFSDPGGDAGHASNMEQLQSASQRQDQTNAVEGHVRYSGEMEEVRAFNFLLVLLSLWRKADHLLCYDPYSSASINALMQ